MRNLFTKRHRRNHGIERAPNLVVACQAVLTLTLVACAPGRASVENATDTLLETEEALVHGRSLADGRMELVLEPVAEDTPAAALTYVPNAGVWEYRFGSASDDNYTRIHTPDSKSISQAALDLLEFWLYDIDPNPEVPYGCPCCYNDVVPEGFWKGKPSTARYRKDRNGQTYCDPSYCDIDRVCSKYVTDEDAHPTGGGGSSGETEESDGGEDCSMCHCFGESNSFHGELCGDSRVNDCMNSCR